MKSEYWDTSSGGGSWDVYISDQNLTGACAKKYKLQFPPKKGPKKDPKI